MLFFLPKLSSYAHGNLITITVQWVPQDGTEHYLLPLFQVSSISVVWHLPNLDDPYSLAFKRIFFETAIDIFCK